MKNFKSYFWGFILWAVNVKLLVVIATWTQLKQIWEFSTGIFSFYANALRYYYEFIFTIPTFTMILSLIFAGLLFYFWLLYFKVYFHRIPSAKSEHSGFWGIFASVFAFLGFGCVACGQTLITSLLLLFVSSGSTTLAHLIGNFSIVLGIIIILFGIRRNLKIFKNRNICRI